MFREGQLVYYVLVRSDDLLVRDYGYVADTADDYLGISDTYPVPADVPVYSFSLSYIFLTLEEANLAWAMLSNDGTSRKADIYA